MIRECNQVKRYLSHQRSEFPEKFLANNFPVSDTEDNTFGQLKRRGTADLPLLRTLLAICQKSHGPNFWEVTNSFVSLAYASLTASRTLLQQLLACLNFTLESEDLSFQGIIQKKYGRIGFLQSKKGTCQRHVKHQLGVWGVL